MTRICFSVFLARSLSYHCQNHEKLSSLHTIDSFFSSSILIHIFCEAVVFCASQGKQCNMSVLNHSPDRKENMHHLCPGKVEKWSSSGFANRLLDSAGFITRCSLVRPAQSGVLGAGCPHSSSYSERLRFIFLGRRHCQSQN